METRKGYALEDTRLIWRCSTGNCRRHRSDEDERGRAGADLERGLRPRIKALEGVLHREEAHAEQEDDESPGQIRMKAFEESAKATTDYLKQARDEQRQD